MDQSQLAEDRLQLALETCDVWARKMAHVGIDDIDEEVFLGAHYAKGVVDRLCEPTDSGWRVIAAAHSRLVALGESQEAGAP